MATFPSTGLPGTQPVMNQAAQGASLKNAMAARFTRQKMTGKMSAAKDERSESPMERAREKKAGIP